MELVADRKAAWMSALRLDAPGEGRTEFFDVLWPRLDEIIDQAPILAEAAVLNLELFGHEGVSYVEFQLSPFGRKIGDRVIDGEELHGLLRDRFSRSDAKATGVTVRLQANVLRFHPDAEKIVEESWAFVDRHRDLWVSVNLV
ncbi:MAG TPA: adenosine deaminase, partial [Vicinamibacteria bacterium]|nr:adenosine deaminase [Vicinamibacteria bacterium]